LKKFLSKKEFTDFQRLSLSFHITDLIWRTFEETIRRGRNRSIRL